MSEPLQEHGVAERDASGPPLESDASRPRRESEEHRSAGAPAAPLVLLPNAPGDEAAPDTGTALGPQWPHTGWALQGTRAKGPARRASANSLGATGGIVLASALALAVLFGWLAYGAFAGHTSHAWAPHPQAQAYYQPIVTPDIPATAPKALPPMMVSTPSATVTLKVDAPPLGGMYGGTGQVQDAFSPAYFAVPAGKTVHVTIVNYDTAWHTFTSPALGLNVWIRPATSHPSTTTFSFTTPNKGYFEWFCDVPCDGYSMQAPGYMKGEIHAVTA